MKKIYLDRNWVLENERVGSVNATVPGCVHTDLIAAGVIENIHFRDNNKKCVWIEDEDWHYSIDFDASFGESVTLVFEGLDTYAEIYLNGIKLGETDNMFIPHRFNVSRVIREKGNVLSVRFRSPIKEVDGRPPRSGAFTTERMYTRRLQCTYGWDWVDRFVTCGIYRPVYLEYANGIDVEDVYIYTESIDRFSAQIYTEIKFKDYENGSVATVEIISPTGETVVKSSFFADLSTFVRRFDITDPMLWYPNGYGEQPLYKMKISVGENVYEETFGIRTLKILQLCDRADGEYRKKALEIKNSPAGQKYTVNEESSSFTVIVNGTRIFCRGGNWVPCEPFPSEERDEKIKNLVGAAKDMGVNFLRVWGGGLFEKKAFYDECDRCGILVAQDFLMACGHYPEKERWFIDALTREAAFAVKYLRNHPCLAWWHGDNENAVKGNDVMDDYMGRDSALRGIAPQIYKYDRSRIFLPSSPYGGDTYASLTVGTSHITNYLSSIFKYFAGEDCSDYKEYFKQYTARFSMEDCSFGAVSRSSMLKFMTEDDLLRDDDEEMMIYHTKTNPGLKLHLFSYIRTFAEKVLGPFVSGEDRFFKYKYIQYEWVRIVMENARRNIGYCDGLSFWMYNDCWPAALGWSFVDYYGMPKAAYYSFKRGAKPVIGSIVADNNEYALYVSSDSDTVKDMSADVYMLDDSGIVRSCSLKMTVNGYGVIKAEMPWTIDDDRIVVCDVRYDGGTDRCFYKSGTLNLKPCDSDIVVSRSDTDITVTAKRYIHAVELECEEPLEDNYFSLLEGEKRVVRVGCADCITVKAYSL